MENYFDVPKILEGQNPVQKIIWGSSIPWTLSAGASVSCAIHSVTCDRAERVTHGHVSHISQGSRNISETIWDRNVYNGSQVGHDTWSTNTDISNDLDWPQRSIQLVQTFADSIPRNTCIHDMFIHTNRKACMDFSRSHAVIPKEHVTRASFWRQKLARVTWPWISITRQGQPKNVQAALLAYV